MTKLVQRTLGLALCLAFVSGCASTSLQDAVDEAKAAAEAARAAAASAQSDAQAASSSANEARNMAAAAQRTADAAQAAAADAKMCCDANSEKLDRMFKNAMSK
ncbi:MAG: alanine-zipper protein [Pseudomonadota bacterium]